MWNLLSTIYHKTHLRRSCQRRKASQGPKNLTSVIRQELARLVMHAGSLGTAA